MVQVSASGVFYDGFTDSPPLAHPEGVAVHRDGSVWCGSENGQLFRISPDGEHCEAVADFGGFLLGIAFDDAGLVYLCHQAEGTVYRFNPATGRKDRLYSAGHGPSLPNHLVVDARRDRLLVSDSHRLDDPRPSVWEICLSSGAVSPWLDEPLDFANGLAFSPDCSELLVAVSWENAIRRVQLEPDGSPGRLSVAAQELPGIPDGIAFIDSEHFLVSLYEPSQVLMVDRDGRFTNLFHDHTAHVMCHPTNIAFRGSDLFTANLGRWHITRLQLNTEGPRSSFPHDLMGLADG